MANIHTPERGTDESFQQYKERRAASQRIVKQLSQGFNPTSVRQHKANTKQKKMYGR